MPCAHLIKYLDAVTISGYCVSEGRFFYRLSGVVGSVDDEQVKLWPYENIGDGKLWFNRFFLRVHRRRSTLYDNLPPLC